MQKKKKKKLNTLDLYVIFSLAVLVIYTISALVVFVLVGEESKTLTICVYGAFSGEIVQCYFIRKGKLHEEIKLLEKKKELDINDEYMGEPQVESYNISFITTNTCTKGISPFKRLPLITN